MSTSTSIIDILLQFLEQSSNLIHQLRPILHQAKNKEQVLKLVNLGQDAFSRLPESVSMALTVAVIFVSSLMVFRVGKSLIGVLVAGIQLVFIVAVAFVIWKLRDPLGIWLEQVLNQ